MAGGSGGSSRTSCTWAAAPPWVVRLDGDRLLQVEDSAAELQNGAGRIGEPIAVEWSDADCVVFDAPRGERLE